MILTNKQKNRQLRVRPSKTKNRCCSFEDTCNCSETYLNAKVERSFMNSNLLTQYIIHIKIEKFLLRSHKKNDQYCKMLGWSSTYKVRVVQEFCELYQLSKLQIRKLIHVSLWSNIKIKCKRMIDHLKSVVKYIHKRQEFNRNRPIKKFI